jgi:DNA primase large subunit
VEQVVDLFKRCAKDFDERRTRYHVEYEKRRLDAGEKPWRCSTVEQHCAGRDIPGALCKNS